MGVAGTRARDASCTRAAVLRAAEEAFAARGFAGTTLREVARAASVSQPLIHHHFGSKDALYREVLRRVVDRAARVTAPGDEASTPLHRRIRALFRFYRENESVCRLTSWSRLEGHTDLWPGEAEAMRTVAEEVGRQQRQGRLRDDLEPRFLAMAAVGLVHFWWDERVRYRGLFPEDADSELLDEAYVEQVVRLLCGDVTRHEDGGDAAGP